MFSEVLYFICNLYCTIDILGTEQNRYILGKFMNSSINDTSQGIKFYFIQYLRIYKCTYLTLFNFTLTYIKKTHFHKTVIHSYLKIIIIVNKA